ncbi:hypothetical protein SynWH8103_01890 [Synechococcus sp. WH 8103]|nr:hypothetical protein SynWH8103_01890 [Synechococcus sp. WH 8103]
MHEGAHVQPSTQTTKSLTASADVASDCWPLPLFPISWTIVL